MQESQFTASNAPAAGGSYQRGLDAFERGNYTRAAECFADSVKATPDNPDAYVSLANALRELGRTDNAVSSYLKGLQIDPRHRDAHYNLANMLKRLGRLDAALHHYRLLVDFHPDFMLGHNNMGNTFKSMGKFKEAIAAYRSALELNPDYAPAHYNLGISEQLRGNTKRAINAYRKAIAIDPKLAPAHANLGTALRVSGRLEEAERHLREAIKLAPQLTEAHSNLAALQERRNQLDEALASLERALEQAPGNHQCLFNKAVVLRRQQRSEEALSILEQLENAQMPEEFLIRRFFEMGKILDAQGHFEQAFNAFRDGNDRQRYSAAFARVDGQRYLERIERMQRLLDQQELQDAATAQTQASPIFLVGFPRSGTTLLDQVLDSHPALCVVEEAQVLSGVAEKLRQTHKNYPECLYDLHETELNPLRQHYLEQIAACAEAQPGQKIVDKLPLNIEHVPLAQRLFPDALFVFAQRNPADVVLSNYFQFYQLNDAMANFSSLEDTVTAYSKVMALWNSCRQKLPLRVHTVRYEALATDFDSESQALTNFLGLEWHQESRAFHQHARKRSLIQTPSYEQVVQPLYQSSIDRWKNYSERMEQFMSLLSAYA